MWHGQVFVEGVDVQRRQDQDETRTGIRVHALTVQDWAQRKKHGFAALLSSRGPAGTKQALRRLERALAAPDATVEEGAGEPSDSGLPAMGENDAVGDSKGVEADDVGTDTDLIRLDLSSGRTGSGRDGQRSVAVAFNALYVQWNPDTIASIQVFLAHLNKPGAAVTYQRQGGEGAGAQAPSAPIPARFTLTASLQCVPFPLWLSARESWSHRYVHVQEVANRAEQGEDESAFDDARHHWRTHFVAGPGRHAEVGWHSGHADRHRWRCNQPR